MVFNRLQGILKQRRAPIAALLAAAALSGCHGDMWNQPRYKAFSRNDSFADGMAMRLPVEGTFAYDGARREWLHPLYEKLTGEVSVPSKSDAAFYTGKVDGQELATNYFTQLTPELLNRGRERYEISCAACHGYTGEGGGIIVQRGFPEAQSLHIDRLREINDGYLFDVITNGFGRMYSYAARVAPEDRWAIIAYIRALQHSQNVDISNPDSDVRRMVLAGIEAQEKAAAEAAADHGHGDGHGGSHDVNDAEQH
jgi:cytochrome c553